MDQRIEAFLADVLALEGETPDAIREAVRAGLADCEAVFRAQEANRRMKENDLEAEVTQSTAQVVLDGDGYHRAKPPVLVEPIVARGRGHL